MSKTFIFLIFMPVLIALGHDGYLYFENPERGIMLSDVGWLWDHYHKETHDQWKIWLSDNDASYMKDYVGFLLQQKAVIVLAVLGLILLVLGWIGHKLVSGKPADPMDKVRMNSVKKGPIKYKRQ